MKNNNHSPKKCHNERDHSQNHKRAVDSEGVEEKSPCSSSSVLGKIPEKLCASEPSSDTKLPSCVTSPVTIFSDEGFDENEYCHGVGNSLYSGCRPCHANPCRSHLDMNEVFVEQCVLYKFKIKQPITREDLLNVIDPKLLTQYRFDDIFKRAFENIETVFAVNMMEIDSTNHIYDLVSKI